MNKKSTKPTNEPYVVQYETKKSEYEYARFWDTRSYEDRSERTLLRSLLKSYPSDAQWLVDIAGSYGRLLSSYSRRFDQVVIADYATNEFYIAKEPAKKEGINLTLIAANAYHLPFGTDSQRAIISVRMMHHLEDPAKFFDELYRVLSPGGVAIIETANKNHLKRFISCLIRFNFSTWKENWIDVGASGLQDDGSFQLIRNYKPGYIQELMEDAGLAVTKKRSISWFRRTWFSRLPAGFVDACEWLMQQTSSLTMMGPSNWFVVQKPGGSAESDVDFDTTIVDPKTLKPLTKKQLSNRSKQTKKAKYLDLRHPAPRR